MHQVTVIELPTKAINDILIRQNVFNDERKIEHFSITVLYLNS